MCYISIYYTAFKTGHEQDTLHACFGKCIDRIKSFGREFHFAGMEIYERSDTKIEALTVRLLEASLLEEN